MTKEQGIIGFAKVGSIGALIFMTVPLWRGLMGESMFVTSVDVFAHILLQVGLAGLYLGYADKLGKFGFISTLMTMIGFIFMVFMKMASGFFRPILMEYAPEAMVGQMAPSPLGEIIGATLLYFPLSTVLFGVSVFISKLPRSKLLGAFLIVGPFGFVLQPFGIYVTPVLFAIAFFYLTYSLWSGKKKPYNISAVTSS
ncbi:hypothetical protein [Paenibacillus sedimenti]|uniref:Uncharacterized protein n=1 Tax=Paenibacillus sedimenti TaxID=2770274 RepID=A0A926KSP0_9BACL|nr:hypothetical protein [Paenibacillus sedimenti]MBD0383265.1 hypothetical protein [Paenibacillus sedimenti]